MTKDPMKDYLDNYMRKNDFDMIQDMMRAIEITENEEFVRTFSDENTGFMFSRDPRTKQITNSIQYKDHSGASFAFTCRCCQYLLQNTNTLDELRQKFIIE